MAPMSRSAWLVIPFHVLVLVVLAGLVYGLGYGDVYVGPWLVKKEGTWSYLLLLLILPAECIVAIIHVMSVLTPSRIWLPSIGAGLLAGAAGPIILYVLIEASADPEAGMAHMLHFLYFGALFVIGFLVSLAFRCRKERVNRSRLGRGK